VNVRRPRPLRAFPRFPARRGRECGRDWTLGARHRTVRCVRAVCVLQQAPACVVTVTAAVAAGPLRRYRHRDCPVQVGRFPCPPPAATPTRPPPPPAGAPPPPPLPLRPPPAPRGAFTLDRSRSACPCSARGPRKVGACGYLTARSFLLPSSPSPTLHQRPHPHPHQLMHQPRARQPCSSSMNTTKAPPSPSPSRSPSPAARHFHSPRRRFGLWPCLLLLTAFLTLIRADDQKIDQKPPVVGERESPSTASSRLHDTATDGRMGAWACRVQLWPGAVFVPALLRGAAVGQAP
jgi:hypothetical protein